MKTTTRHEPRQRPALARKRWAFSARTLLPAALALGTTWFAISSATAAVFVNTGPLNTARHEHTATLLSNGKVLVVGGVDSSGALSSAELYDPTTGTWTTTSALSTNRHGHTATLLPSGQVLVVGGLENGNYLSSAEIYDSATCTWIATGVLSAARAGHTATLLSSGQVLIAGGENSSGALAGAELYDPATGSWTATGALEVARHWHTATLLPNDKVLVAGGTNSTSGSLSSAELYDPATGLWTTTGALTFARALHTATLLPNGQVLTVGGENASGALASAEAYDPNGGMWAATGELSTGRYHHTSTLLPNGQVLIAGGATNALATETLSSADLYDPIAGTWTAASALAFARAGHTATLLPNGQVLAAGGQGDSETLSTVELYCSASGTWTTTGTLNPARYFHVATLLPNGKALVTGGFAGSYLSSSALYNPATGLWTSTGTLPAARYGHTTTLLPNGKVLLVGGFNGSSLSNPALYDPAAGLWTTITPPSAARSGHTATLLSNGKVLVAGGRGNSGALASAELYDPITGNWTATGALNTSREQHTATLLSNGKVLVAAGYASGGYLSSAELYNPATGRWTTTGTLTNARSYHSATLLPNGKVLVAGGRGNSGALASAELYDSITGNWTVAGALGDARSYHTATLLPNGQVLVAGGYGVSAYLSSTELFDPALGTWTATSALNGARGYHTATLLANGKVLVAAGTGGTAPYDLSSAELYDVGLGFNASWQPQIATFTSPLVSGGSLAFTGSRFRGVSGASGGNCQDSSSAHPVVQLCSVESGQTRFLTATNWSTNTFDSAPVLGFPSGWALATMFVNGIPSPSSLVLKGWAEATVTLSNLSHTYDGTAKPVTVTTTPPDLAMYIAYNGSTNAPTNAGSYTVIGLVDDENYRGGATNTLVIEKASATVTLIGLDRTYNGKGRPVAATTVPPGLSVNFFYDGSPNAPTNPGSYTVIGTIDDINYQGSETNTMVIHKATATVTLGDLSQIYDGTARNAAATTQPPSLYDGSPDAPTNAGSYTVIGSVSDPFYEGSATGMLVVSKGAATVTLGNLSQIHDGTAKGATATTVPPGLAVNFTYNGSPNPPIGPGSYVVVGTIDDPNYQGSTTGTLIISLQLAAPGLDANGRFTFTFYTAAGVNYTVEFSTDFQNWIPAVTFSGSGGLITIVDPDTGSLAQRFYRVNVER